MELQKFLMEHKDDWEEVLDKEPYCLKWNKWKGFVSFKYNQIRSDFSNPIVREARGAVFVEGTWECASRAFDKFSTMQNLTLRQLIGVPRELWKK